MFSSLRRLTRTTRPSPYLADPLLDRRAVEALARVAHEMSQPLSAALMAFESIRECAAEPRAERACAVLERQFMRLSRLVNDLAETTRLGMIVTPLHLQQVDLRRVVEDVAEAVTPQVIEKHQHLDTHVPAEPVWVDADWARLQQVVSNLVVNGIRYTDEGGLLEVHVSQRAGQAVLTVTDTGCGIPAPLLSRIFEPFTRGDEPSTPGLGVGLSVVRQLVELHGGTVRASSGGPGRGSQFVVTLPAHGSHAQHRPSQLAG